MKIITRDLLAELIVEALEDTIIASALRCLAGYCQATTTTPPSMAVDRFLLPAPVAEREAVHQRLATHPLLAWDLRGRLERVTLSTTFASEWPEIVTTLKRYGAAIEDWTPNDTDSPITNALRKGVLLFNHHLFFAVHEVLEAQWMRETGAEKRFLQGLVQIAVAFYHLGNRNLRGALSLLQDGIEKIAPHQPVYLGIELRDFIAALEICDAELRHLNPDSLAQFPVTLIPPIRFTLTTDSETKHGLSSDKKVSD